MLTKIDMRQHLNELIQKQVKKEEKTMENSNNKESKKSYIAYVYGQIYSEFLKGEKQEYVLVKNTKAQTWGGILNWLKNNNYIEDFKLGDTPETAGEVVVKGFDEDNMIYEKYCRAVRENIEKAM